MSLGVAGKTRIEIDTGTIGDGDSIAAYITDSAGTLLTSTLIGSAQSLDVNVANLEYLEDSAHTTGDRGLMPLAVRNDAGGTLASADGDYTPLTTNATGALYTSSTLTNDPSHLEDSGHISGDRGNFLLAVRNDAAAATLTSADADYSGIAVDANGRVFTSTSLSAEFAEDSAHTTGENIVAMGAVREDDSVSNVSAEGDYSNIQTWSEGSVRVVDNANGTNLQQVVTVGTSAAQLPAANLANRKMLMIQNVSNNPLFVGSSTVTADETATGGIQIGKGGFITLEAGPANDVYGISDTAAQPIAVYELS